MSSYNVVAINLGNFGSTGTIAREILNKFSKGGNSVFFAYAGYPNNKTAQNKDILICSNFFRKVFSKLVSYSGLNGCFSVLHTLLFLRKLDKIGVDLLHFHNLHNSYINLPMLMAYVKKRKIPVVWTLHDCWSFTGRCPHFVLRKCNKWKNGCYKCSFPKNAYPQSRIDTSDLMWKLKKKWFTGIENCTIVTPSEWLSKLVKESFLKNYSVKVIKNGVDLSTFKPVESDFRERFGLLNKKMILGVAFDWGYSKGLDVFIELSGRLPPNYQIVLVGVNDDIMYRLPEKILPINRTNNQCELAEIYSAADVFVNPTREEVLGMVNIESLACGTPVISFKTGGCPECVDESCGVIVECDDIDAIEREVRRVCENHPFDRKFCVNRAKIFNIDNRYDDYLKLYNEVINP